MLHYQIHFGKNNLAHVRLTFIADSDQPQVYMPTWIAGSYLIREFARLVERVTANHPIQKINKNHWQIDAKAGDSIEIGYFVYGFDVSVRTVYIDDMRVFANFVALCILPKGQENIATQIDLTFDFVADLALGAPYTKTGDNTFSLQFANIHEAFDTPFEYARQQKHSFVANGITHDFFVSDYAYTDHAHTHDLAKICVDLQKICTFYIDKFKRAPFDHYTFLTYAAQGIYGGLEHHNSTALVIDRDWLNPENRDDYLSYLGLCSHEYLHAWWVKAVRFDSMIDNPLEHEVFSQMLWVFEGFTNYIDDWTLLQSGVISNDEYARLLGKQINSYLNTDGASIQTLAESSLDAWIKYYRPNENSKNATTSYYVQGSLFALCIDAALRAQGTSLIAVMARFFERYQDTPIAIVRADMDDMLGQILGSTWQELARYLDSTEPLPLQQSLHALGFDLKIDTTHELGATLKDDLSISYLRRESALASLGLCVNDRIISIDGAAATRKGLEKLASHTGKVRIDFIRQGALISRTGDISANCHTQKACISCK